MVFNESERVAVFIDGQALYSIQKNLKLEIDFKKFLGLFRDQARLVRAFYYATIADGDAHVGIEKLIDWLDYNGFSIRRVPRSNAGENPLVRRRSLTPVSIEIAVEAMSMTGHMDHCVILSFDPDLAAVLLAMSLDGKRVTILGSLSPEVPITTPDELRRLADQFVDLKTLLPSVSRSSPHAD